MAILIPNAKLRLPPGSEGMEGRGLATIDVTFRRLDKPWLLQNFVWQEDDICPWFPVMNAFLIHWITHNESPPLLSKIMHPLLKGWVELREMNGVFRLQ